MSRYEAEGRQMFDFMTPDDFDNLWVNIPEVYYVTVSRNPNGYYERIPNRSDDEDLPASFAIMVPGGLEQSKANLMVLKQMELVRRELRDGKPNLPRGGNRRLFAQIELELAATSFYSANKEVVDQAISEIIEWHPDFEEPEELI